MKSGLTVLLLPVCLLFPSNHSPTPPLIRARPNKAKDPCHERLIM